MLWRRGRAGAPHVNFIIDRRGGLTAAPSSLSSPRAEPVRLRFRVLLLFGVAAVASPVSLAVLGVQFFARRYGTGGPKPCEAPLGGSLTRSRVAARRRRRGYR